jgi:hypothetical protein
MLQMKLVEPDAPMKTFGAISVKILNADIYIQERAAKGDGK